ncbi:MAG: ComEA family DNA-binding protein [Chloroflexi bacterium]|nr:ComEA family DNA-binding protein [Chloroflexota bacterium]
MLIRPPQPIKELEQVQYPIFQQQTVPNPAIDAVNIPSTPEPDEPVSAPAPTQKQILMRLLPVALILASGLALYFTWHPSLPGTDTAGSAITQQDFTAAKTTNSTTPSTSVSSSGGIQVYILGAVKKPGVYTLRANARIYELLQAAGGPLSDANLVAVNLAAKLTDGQEIYITRVGEEPPTMMGSVSTSGTAGTDSSQLVNINTASATELRQSLHISAATAQAIINYRLQQGPYTSVDQLASVVSKSIYDKIKGMVTV